MTPATYAGDGTRRAELWLRADVPLGADDRQERLLERSRSVPAFETVQTRLVPNRLPLSGAAVETPTGADLRGRLRDARQWAAVADVDLDPYLPVSEESSMVADRTRRLLTFPSVTLVEYLDDEVVGVTPHVDGDEVVSVEAHLERIAKAAEGEVLSVEP